MVTGLWYTHIHYVGLLSWFWRCNKYSSPSWALEDILGYWLGFGILILILILSLVFDTLMIQILALYLDFEGAKNIHVLYVLIWGFEGWWRFLSWVWHLDLDFDMVTGLWSHDPNCVSISWIWRCKDYSSPLSSHLGLRRMLEVTDLGFTEMRLCWDLYIG